MRAIQKFAVPLVAALLVASGAQAQTAIWSRVPWPSEFMRAHPPAARQGGIAQIRCAPQPSGELASCEVYSEAPEGLGFGAAALTLAPRFRLKRDAVKTLEAEVLLPVRFEPLPPAPPWREAAFGKTHSYARYGVAGPYYPDRAARAGVAGEVIVDCAAQGDGRLTDCRVASVVPSGMGFDDATLIMAQRGFMRAGPPPDGASSIGTFRFRALFELSTR